MTMLNPDEKIEAKTPKNFLRACIDTQDRVGLHGWIKAYFHLDIPQQKICPDHQAPFDFVADYLFGLVDLAIVVGNRTGGKTLDFGVLDTTMSFYSDNTEVATVAAIQSQAKKGYSYFREFSSLYPFSENVERMTMNETMLKNNSSVQILTGTMSGVNSPHPQLVFLDEIDLMVWPVLQQALSMAQSKNGVRARTVLTSTRKFANGPMQRMIDEAGDKGAKVYMWCIWEVVQALPKNNPELLEEIYEEFGSALPAKIKECNGYYDWKDAIVKHRTLDIESWETEWLCSRPGLEGVIYGSSYSDDNNLIANEDWMPSEAGYIYLFEDFGFGEGHPDVVLFAWIPQTFDRMVIFDELYLYGHESNAIWQEIDNKLQEYGHRLPDRATQKEGTILGWIGDPAGLTEIADRKQKGAPMMGKAEDPKLYVINNGLPLVRKLMESGRLMITPRCKNLRLEILSYKKKKNLDGTYSKDPEKKNDHGPDALRYGVIRLYQRLQSRILKEERENVDTEPVIVSTKSKPLSKAPTEQPITSGLLTTKEWR